MDNLFEQIEANKQNPDAYGWYDTDKGSLFFFLEEKEWSCRDDRISEEYPKFWYKHTLNSEPALRMKIENLEKALKESESKRFVLPDNATLDLMKRINDLEKLAKHRGDRMEDYQDVFQEIVDFAGPLERVREELKKLKEKANRLDEIGE